MKYYIIAGERSGDLHGSNLIKSLQKIDRSAEIRCWGGDYMKSAGGELVVHYNEMAVMGFLEVLKNFRKLKKRINFCKSDILAYNPDVLVLIDFGGFNMRIARHAKKSGIKVFYYISPKVWAWHESRALKIKKYVDRMFVILPFEKEFFQKFDYEVDYVGNPLLDAVRDFEKKPGFLEKNGTEEKPVIAVLPGSRKQEISVILKYMLSITANFPDHQFIVAGLSNISQELYDPVRGNTNVHLVFDQTYDLLSYAEAAIVTSGTATLETALFEVPQVVCYKTSTITYAIAKSLIKVDFISLVNLIAAKEVVKELIQSGLNTKNLSIELQKIVIGGKDRDIQLRAYENIKKILGNKKASDNLARLMMKYLSE